MTTVPPPGTGGPDEPVVDSFAAEPPPAEPSPAEPVLDSFAAEQPAEPADAATGASTPVELPAGPSEVPGTLGSPPAAEPARTPDGPRGSEGLTTAPPPLGGGAATTPEPEPAPEPEPEPVTPVEPVEPVVPVEPVEPVEPVVPVEPVEPAVPVEPTVAAPAPGRSRAWLPLTAVGLAVALLAGATGWLAWQLRQQDRADQASVDAVAAARDAARLLFSYDHKTLQADFDKGLAVTTGDFRTQYQRTTKDVVSPVATQYKAVVKAEVVEAAVVDAQADEVVALVFLNQATTSTRVQGQQVDQSRVRMRLVPRDGRWLVEEVKAL